MVDFKAIAQQCVAYFSAQAQREGPTQPALCHGEVCARRWLALLEQGEGDLAALYAEMREHRRYRYWSVHWHYMARMLDDWREREGFDVEAIGEAEPDGLKETFECCGFVVIRQLIAPDDAARLKDETRRLLQAHRDHAGVFVGLAANSAVFREAIRDPRLLDALEPLLGHDIEFLSDKIVYKSAEMDFGSPWHQDWPYWQGAHKLSIWVALDAATPENGCLKLLPGSHLTNATHDGIAVPGEGFGHRLKEGVVDETRAISVPCAVGDAVIFHDLTLHASYPNTSGQDRWAWIVTYRSAAEPDLSYEWSVAAEVVRGKRHE